MIEGYATSEGTKEFLNKQEEETRVNFRNFAGLFLSNVGIGTYLGNPDAVTDDLVKNAVKKSINSGVNASKVLQLACPIPETGELPFSESALIVPEM